MSSKHLTSHLLVISAVLSPLLAWGQITPVLSAVPTFHNIGIEAALTSSIPAQLTVSMQVQKKNSGQPFKTCMPLCQIATNIFAGSVLNLQPNTTYTIRLNSSVFPSGETNFDVTTRSEAFTTSTNRTIHVSALTGSDSNTGLSFAQALRTLNAALGMCQSGDKILLYAGRYYEGDISISRSGSSSQPITIENAPGASPVLDGTDTNFIPQWVVHDAGNNIYRTASTVQPVNAYLNGRQFFHRAAYSELVDDPYDMNYGYFADGTHIYARFPGGTAPGTNVFTIPRYTTCLTIEANHWQIRGLEFCYYGRDLYCRAIFLNQADSNLIENCVFHHNDIGIGIKRGSDYNVIQRCSFDESPANEWAFSAVKASPYGYEAGGIYVYESFQNNVGNIIRYCQFTGQFDSSHLFNAEKPLYTDNMDYYGNTVTACGDDAIELDGGGSNVRIYSNFFNGFFTGVSAAPAARGPTYIFRNVMTRWYSREGMEGYPIKLNHGESRGIDWIYLLHNTMYTETTNQIGFLIKANSFLSRMIVRNNIIAGTEHALESWVATIPIDFDYNGYFTANPALLISWTPNQYTNLAAFTAIKGYETNGVVGRPCLKNPSQNDYALRSESPFIDKGLSIPGLNDGFVGPAPDLGAFEFVHSGLDATAEGSHLRANWDVVSGAYYRVQASTSLTGASWSAITDWTRTTGTVFRLDDDMNAGNNRFYRLEIR